MPAELDPVADLPAVVGAGAGGVLLQRHERTPGASSMITWVVVPTYTRSTIVPSIETMPCSSSSSQIFSGRTDSWTSEPSAQSGGTSARQCLPPASTHAAVLASCPEAGSRRR